MSEELFKVGSVYRDRCGEVVKLCERTYSRQGQPAAYAMALDSRGEFTINYGYNILADGSDGYCEGDEFHLFPGELSFRDGEWVGTPVVEEKKEELPIYTKEQVDWILWGKKPTKKIGGGSGDIHQSDARMLANDLKNGPAKPYIKKCACQRCDGTRGGVPGNENIINGRVLCDYCAADTLQRAAHPPIPGLSLSPDKEGASHRLGGRFGTAH